MTKKINIIIPIHEYDNAIESLLERAVRSIPNGYPITLSLSKKVHDDNFKAIESFASRVIPTETELNYVFANDDKSDFCTLVNNSVSKDYEWFSILEFDDEYTNIWFNHVEEEMEYKHDVSIFLPLTELIDFNKHVFISYGNEAPWASSFSNEIGYIDNDCLQSFFDFYLTGCVFNTKDWLNCGGLKPSIKVTFWYEFLLRLTSKDKKAYVIPKLGYRHFVNRENSLYSIYRKTITNEESKWWYDLAKEECSFKQDRNKTYNKQNSEKGAE